MNEIEELIAELGESQRRLIMAALDYLNSNEYKWKLSEPINRREYIKDLITKNNA